MKEKIMPFVTVAMLISLMLFSCQLTITQASPSAPPLWYQVNQNGFGQPGTYSGPELFVFGQNLYAYASGNEYGLFRMLSAVDRVWEELFTPVNTGVAFQPLGSYLYAYDFSNKQLWWIKEGESFISGNWKQVTSNGLPGGVSPVPMTDFNSKLYGVYYTSSGTFEIWRSVDIGKTVMNWERVVQNSFGDSTNNQGVDIMAVFNNHIYAGTMTRTGVFGSYLGFGDGVEIWESSSGDLGTWTQVNYDGFGTEMTDPISGDTFRTNQDIGSWAVYKASNQQQEYLYIGTLAHFGAQIWRYDGTGKSGWTDVSPSWAFDPVFASNTKRFTDMGVFQGSLYVTEGYPSAMLDKYDGTNWSIEVGETEPPFASVNRGLVSLAVLENKLYVGPISQEGCIEGDQVWGYPFVFDIAITDVKASPTTVIVGNPVSVEVKVLNEGTDQQTFDVNTYYDSTLIGTMSVTLSSGASTTLTFTWDTTSASPGTYTIRAEVPPVTGETHIADNVFIDGKVTITPVPVYVDIKPCSWPNPIKVGSRGTFAVAICGTEDFDVTTIDPATVKLYIAGIAQGVSPIRWSYRDVATPYIGSPGGGHALNGDGYLDIVFHFDTQTVVTKLGLAGHVGETIPLIIKGNLYPAAKGLPIQGQDYVWILKK